MVNAVFKIQGQEFSLSKYLMFNILISSLTKGIHDSCLMRIDVVYIPMCLEYFLIVFDWNLWAISTLLFDSGDCNFRECQGEIPFEQMNFRVVL